MDRDNILSPISFFIPALNGGGAQRVVVNLANALVDIVDYPIHIVLVKKKGEFLNLVRSEVKVIDLKGKRTLFSCWKLARYIKINRPKVIMSSMDYANVICTYAHRFSCLPCRLVLREASVVRAPEGNLLKRFRTQAVQGLMRYCYSKSDAVVANSYDTLQTLIDTKISIADKIHVLFNPVIMQKDIERPLNSDDLVLQAKSPYICAIGRLSEPKGFDILLDAFAKLKSQNIDLVILGEGKLRGALTEQAQRLGIAERVHMPGFIDNPMAVLQKAKVFVLSSRWEGFGNVLVEALAAGVPIVSTDCPGGPREILENGAHGYLVPFDDPGALTDGIEMAVSNPKGSPESRKKRAADFSAEKIAREYLEKVLLPDEYVNGWPDKENHEYSRRIKM